MIEQGIGTVMNAVGAMYQMPVGCLLFEYKNTDSQPCCQLHICQESERRIERETDKHMSLESAHHQLSNGI